MESPPVYRLEPSTALSELPRLEPSTAVNQKIVRFPALIGLVFRLRTYAVH